MYIKVTWHKFRDAINDFSPAQFTNEGLEVLFDHLETLEKQTGEKIEFDVIDICNDWKESTYESLASDYNIDPQAISIYFATEEDESDEDFKFRVFDYFADHTIVLKVGTDNLLIKNF